LGIKKLKILVIEDDLIEVMKLKRAVDKLALDITLLDAKNGEEALDLLGNHQNLPDLIFLDLNMPKISGLEFLAIVKKDDVLRYLPTVILTTSNNRKDVLECYKMGVAGYILKPLKYDEYVDKIHKALLYWSENELIKI
jgi:CheY-like chemotaxis protein